jgi:hypothetical protein
LPHDRRCCLAYTSGVVAAAGFIAREEKEMRQERLIVLPDIPLHLHKESSRIESIRT